MANNKIFIASTDWTKNWQASISTKITAITLWPTIAVTFLVAYIMLDGIEDNIRQNNDDTSIKIAYHVSHIWPESEKLSFHEKLEYLRIAYQDLDLQGFELSNQDQIYRIGNFTHDKTYIDLPLASNEKDDLQIRVFFPDPLTEAASLRNWIVVSIFFSLFLFALFLSMATHIIIDKPLKLLVDASKEISQGYQNIRADSKRKDEFGTLSRFFNLMVDNLIEQKNLEHEAKTDFLTGIANRRHFDEAIKAEIRRSTRDNNPLSLIMCDVDFFKQYNDTYNHVAGDLCLKHIARTLDNIFTRTSDLPARYGGEEFVVILPNTDEVTALNMASTLREEVKKLNIPHSKSSAAPYITLSIGVATLIDHSKENTAKMLIESADQALYRAKKNGRNRVEVIILGDT